ncbi:MAG: ABC transporter permease [Gammaproteobacteria bacterium]|nr:ABC transporter permease [Gammaproteobacteria bacterium]
MKDRFSRVVVVVPPLLQTLAFGYAASFDLNHVPFAVYDEDGGAGARELVARFAAAPAFQQRAVIHRHADIRPLIDNRKVLMVLHIGPQFGRRLALGEPAPLQIVIDGRNSNTAAIALNYARSIVTGFNRQWAADRGRGGPPAFVEARAWFNPNLESRWFFVPGIIGLLTLVVTMMVTALSVAREREQGTFDQLLVTPMRPAEILVGKALPGLIIGVLEGAVITLIAVYWFQVPLLGSLTALFVGLCLFLLSAIGIGLMISSLSVTLQQALLGAFLFLVPAVILSGFATPIANMPEAVQLLTYANPLRYFVVVLRGVFLQGAPFGLLVGQFWPMAVIGLVTLTAAGWLFRRRMH